MGQLFPCSKSNEDEDLSELSSKARRKREMLLYMDPIFMPEALSFKERMYNDSM